MSSPNDQFKDSTNTYLTEDPCNSCSRLDSGICLSYQSETTSSLCTSSTSNDISNEISKLSINSSVKNNIFCQNKDGDTPLHLAIIKNDQNTFWQIIDQNPPRDYLNIQNFEFHQTPLHLAVEMEMTSMIEFLVAIGVATFLKDKNGNTPLHAACAKGDFVSVTRLMMYREKMADNLSNCQHRCCDVVTPQTMHVYEDELKSLNYTGKSCLHLALETQGLNRMRIIKFLICQCGADINLPEARSGYTILHELVRLGDLEGLKELFRLPIPETSPPLLINPLNYEHMTPFDMAVRLPNCEVRQMISSVGGVTSDLVSSSDSSSSESL